MAKGKYQKWLEPDSLILLEGWARNGLTDKQIAKNIGISEQTLNVWKNRFPSFSESLKRGKEVVDIMVENAMLKSALGHVVKVKKPIKLKTEKQKVGEGKIVEERVEYVEEEVYIKPEVVAQIFWLKNRRMKIWRDHPENDELIDARIEHIDAQTSKMLGENVELEDISDAENLVYGGGAVEGKTQNTENE